MNIWPDQSSAYCTATLTLIEDRFIEGRLTAYRSTVDRLTTKLNGWREYSERTGQLQTI